MAFTAHFVFQQDVRTEICLLSSVILLLDCWSYFPLTDKIQIQSHGNTVLRDQKNQTSEWVSVTGIGLCPCPWSPGIWALQHHGMGGLSPCHSSSGRAKAASAAAFVRSVPACCRVANGPSRPAGGRAVLAQQLRGSCLAAGQSCMHRGGKTPCLLVLGWAVFWKLSESWYSGCAEMPFADGRKGLAAQNAAGVLTSWAQQFSLEVHNGLFKSCPCFCLAAHPAVPSMVDLCWLVMVCAVQVWTCAQGACQQRTGVSCLLELHQT